MGTDTGIIDDIDRKRIQIIQDNREPRAIYLGYHAFRDLRQSVFLTSVVCLDDDASRSRVACFGLPIYEVNDPYHLEVV